MFPLLGLYTFQSLALQLTSKLPIAGINIVGYNLQNDLLRQRLIKAQGAADGAGGVGGVPPLPSLRHTPSKIPEMQGIIGERNSDVKKGRKRR